MNGLSQAQVSQDCVVCGAEHFTESPEMDTYPWNPSPPGCRTGQIRCLSCLGALPSSKLYFSGVGEV